MSQTVHATCVALNGRGLLLRGPAGSGKSGLALRLIAEAGAALVADDQTAVAAENERPIARRPATLPEGAEARGVGFVAPPAAGDTEVVLVVDVVPGTRTRLPEPQTASLAGVTVPRAEIDPADPAAVSKLALAVDPHARVGAPAPADAAATRAARPVVLVTGMSGAGRSTLLRALEDMGYEAVDNLPLPFLGALARDGGRDRPLAVGVDIRTRSFAVDPFLDALARLRADPGLAVTLVFLDCEDAVLQRRYTETRRRHPLARERPLSDGLAAERRLVDPLHQRADLALDTSTLSVKDLRRLAAAHLGLDTGAGMVVVVTSFAFRNGLPREADWVMDVRFLTNPNDDPALRPRSGRDAGVAAHVAADPAYPALHAGVAAMLRRLIPRYEREGKSYLTLAVGCTGGRHRSVAVAEAIAATLRRLGRQPVVSHRDLRDDAEGEGESGESS